MKAKSSIKGAPRPPFVVPGPSPRTTRWWVENAEYRPSSPELPLELPHPHDHIDMGHLHPVRRRGNPRDADRIGGNVLDPLLVLDEEMMMVGGVGVEIAA